jgi:hypothetical protein
MGSTETDIGSPCTQCLRHGDPIHARKGLRRRRRRRHAITLRCSVWAAITHACSCAARSSRAASLSTTQSTPSSSPLEHSCSSTASCAGPITHIACQLGGEGQLGGACQLGGLRLMDLSDRHAYTLPHTRTNGSPAPPHQHGWVDRQTTGD